jgi:hypothetical protein
MPTTPTRPRWIPTPTGLVHGWHLTGPGPARFGWAWVHPCSREWLGRTKAEAIAAAISKGLLPTTPTAAQVLACRKRCADTFAGVDAFALVDGADMVGRVSIRLRKTARGHTARCFFHLLGSPMVEGKASGAGYDLGKAALDAAIRAAMGGMDDAGRARWAPVCEALDHETMDNALAKLAGVRAFRIL